jgi:hypothetical protein
MQPAALLFRRARQTHSYCISLQPVGKYFKHFSQCGGIFRNVLCILIFAPPTGREKSQLESHLICISFIKKEREFYVNLHTHSRTGGCAVNQLK